MLKPVGMTKSELFELLRDITLSVADDDSFEGSLTYAMPVVDGPLPEGWNEWPDAPVRQVRLDCDLSNIEGPARHKK